MNMTILIKTRGTGQLSQRFTNVKSERIFRFTNWCQPCSSYQPSLWFARFRWVCRTHLINLQRRSRIFDRQGETCAHTKYLCCLRMPKCEIELATVVCIILVFSVWTCCCFSQYLARIELSWHHRHSHVFLFRRLCQYAKSSSCGPWNKPLSPTRRGIRLRIGHTGQRQHNS